MEFPAIEEGGERKFAAHDFKFYETRQSCSLFAELSIAGFLSFGDLVLSEVGFAVS